jgi:hypothetical protein
MILKERPFGLTNAEGNHGEDVKDYWFYTDNLPTHAYASMVYKYPHAPFPYDDLRRTNRDRGQDVAEYELFDALEDHWLQQRYFDVQVEYAKANPEDTYCRITATNRGPRPCGHSCTAAPLVPQHLVVGTGANHAAHHKTR